MLGGSLEDNVLCALVWSETLAPEIALKLTPADFSTRPYRRVAEVAIAFLGRHRRPARVHIVDLLESDLQRGHDGRLLGDILRDIEALGPNLNEDYVLGELERWLDIRRLTEAVNNAGDLLENGKLEEAREALRARDLLPPADPGVFLRDTEQWLSFLRSEEDGDVYSSGIDILDERGIRPARGELYCLLAASGMGKSWFLINAGKHNMLNGMRVLHITLENSLDTTLQRYTQCFLSLTRDEAPRSVDLGIFKRTSDDEHPDRRNGRIDRHSNEAHVEPDNPLFDSLYSLSRRELTDRLEPFQRRGGLLVKYFPTGSLTFAGLTAYLDTLERDGYKPDLVLLDYLTLMQLNITGEYGIRLSIGQLARNLRGLANIRNFALMTVMQAQREAAGKLNVYARHIAEDWSVVATSDTFITYSQTIHERGQHIARIFVDKARNAPDKWFALITQSYEIGQFCLDSHYMTIELKNQINDEEGEPPKGPERW